MDPEQIKKCLQDAGCSSQELDRFLSVYSQLSLDQRICMIRQFRYPLMEELHRVQKKVDCLDYLVNEMKREVSSYGKRSININK